MSIDIGKSPGLTGATVSALEEEFPGEPLALELFGEFLGHAGYDREQVRRLIGVAGARGRGPSWGLRRAAVLMLESRLLALGRDDPDEAELLLRQIAEVPPGLLKLPPDAAVIKEGYASENLKEFWCELLDRIARNGRVHGGLRGRDTSAEALGDFLAMARQDCRLTLARYLFDPPEVARRIREEVRTSRGITDPFDDDLSAREAERCLRDLPRFEEAVARGLLDGSAIHWASDATGSRLNGLVEYPLGTVVLAVKPPGSDVEFEIKRAGRRGARPFTVVHEREGSRVPTTHRLDGGSMSRSLKSEASASALLNAVFRLVHGTRAPVSRPVALRGIHEVPCAKGRSQILEYFTEKAVFGDTYGTMRAAMAEAIGSFSRELEEEPLKVPGPLGTTLAFLAQVGPAQALLVGTSSYRLDILSRYLSEDGPELYFTRGLGVGYTAADARRFAETLLDEALGTWTPAGAPYRGHAAFIEDVLSMPDNRRRADGVFLSLCDQIGQFWGTTFGMKWYSHGESFVGRNVGLKAGWEAGRWRVRIIFMDHDGFAVETDNYSPGGAIRGCRRDANNIFGRPVGSCVGELDHLATIYRLDAAMKERGRAEVRRSASDAFRRTRAALAGPAPLWSTFRRSYIKAVLDWDEAAAVYLRARRTGHDQEPALAAAAEHFNRLGNAETPTTPWVEAIRLYADFLERFPDLFGIAEPAPEG